MNFDTLLNTLSANLTNLSLFCPPHIAIAIAIAIASPLMSEVLLLCISFWCDFIGMTIWLNPTQLNSVSF